MLQDIVDHAALLGGVDGPQLLRIFRGSDPKDRL
jgi:hypothetical protein